MRRGLVVALGILAFIAAVTVAVWMIGPKVSLWIQTQTLAAIDVCNDPASANACDAAFARLGQTGDLFGSMSSVFSGLALVAIALTIWVDASNRRTSRKPLVVCQINDDKPVTFDDPNTVEPRAVRAGFYLDVSALNDVAINVSVAARLASSRWTKSFQRTSVPVPLPNGGASQKLAFALRLDRKDIESLVAAYRKDGHLKLAIEASAGSLEGVTWETSFDYLLTFRPSDQEKIEALIGDEENCRNHWASQVTVQADHSVSPGTWRHRRAPS